MKFTSSAVGLALISLAVAASKRKDEVIQRDYIIVGGGSTGVYSAVTLLDKSKTVAVIESSGQIGGHAETYIEPATQAPINLGVTYFQNTATVNSYLSRLNVSTLTIIPGGTATRTVYVDFESGLPSNYTPSGGSELQAALGSYTQQLQKYPYLEAGFAGIPSPVPEDLTIPFGAFAAKYNLGPAVQTIWLVGQGLGNILAQPTLYVLKAFGFGVIQSFQRGFVVPSTGNSRTVYDAAANVVGASNIFLSSKIVSTSRCDTSVEVKISTPTGNKIIRGKKLIFTIPPKVENLKGWDLSSAERSLFQQFNNSAYYGALIKHDGSLDALAVQNAGNSTPWNVPTMPGIYSLSPQRVSGYTNVKYGSPKALPDAQVKKAIIDDIERLDAKGTLKTGNVEIAAYINHTPFELTVSTQAIKDGFYNKLYALQGQKSTYYTGATFHTHDSALLWQFTSNLLSTVP